MSPCRIEEFEAAYAEDPADAMATLEADLTASRGPLVEQDPEHPEQVRVTFVAMSDAPVSVRCSMFGGWSALVGVPMRRIEGSDVWVVATHGRPDLSTTYQYVRGTLGDVDPATFMQEPQRLHALVLEWAERGFADPFNPAAIPPAAAVGNAALASPSARDRWESVLSLPGSPPLPWYDVPASPGCLQREPVTSRALENTRTVSVWTPPGHDPTSDYPVLLLFDGEAWLTLAQVDRLLANLTSRGRIPPLVAIMVHNPTGLSRMTEMPCNPGLVTFVTDELIPMLRPKFGLTTDPSRIVAAGTSYGGLAANWLGFCRAEVIGNVLSMSAALWWGQLPPGTDPADADPSLGRDDQPAWLVRQYASTPRKPLRFWIDVGTLEGEPHISGCGPDTLQVTREFRDVLTGIGYDIAGYREQPGAHDFANWRHTLPEALTTLFEGRDA